MPSSSKYALMKDYGSESRYSSTVCELIYSFCWVPFLPESNAQGPLIPVQGAWNTAQEKPVPQLPTKMCGRVCARVNVHTKTSQRVPAFLSAIISVCETLILSATEQCDRKRWGLAVLAGKVFCDLCTLLETAGLAVFLTHWLQATTSCSLKHTMLTVLSKSDFSENLFCEQRGSLVL